MVGLFSLVASLEEAGEEWRRDEDRIRLAVEEEWQPAYWKWEVNVCDYLTQLRRLRP